MILILIKETAIAMTWVAACVSGGAAGTTLDQLIINGDQQITGFSVGDVFFDTKDGGLGGDHGFEFLLASATGIDGVRATVVDGETQLILDFEGFHAGDRLVFEIDVDEVEDYDPFIEDLATINEGFDPITSGVEFQGSQLTAHFSATHFHDAVGSAEFRNRYDEQLVSSELDLPADNAGGQRDRTAAAFILRYQSSRPFQRRSAVMSITIAMMTGSAIQGKKD